MRLTKQVIQQQLLNQNEGFKRTKSFTSRNSSYDNYYEIVNGELHVRSVGKTSWADSRYDTDAVADEDRTRRFLRDNLHLLNTDGLGD
jgi:hypothetical protein